MLMKVIQQKQCFPEIYSIKWIKTILNLIRNRYIKPRGSITLSSQKNKTKQNHKKKKNCEEFLIRSGTRQNISSHHQCQCFPKKGYQAKQRQHQLWTSTHYCYKLTVATFWKPVWQFPISGKISIILSCSMSSKVVNYVSIDSPKTTARRGWRVGQNLKDIKLVLIKK